jgi:hypothetical protein
MPGEIRAPTGDVDEELGEVGAHHPTAGIGACGLVEVVLFESEAGEDLLGLDHRHPLLPLALGDKVAKNAGHVHSHLFHDSLSPIVKGDRLFSKLIFTVIIPFSLLVGSATSEFEIGTNLNFLSELRNLSKIH